jgi:hypothetical protein
MSATDNETWKEIVEIALAFFTAAMGGFQIKTTASDTYSVYDCQSIGC